MIKKVLSYFLVTGFIISSLNLQVFASEVNTADNEEDVEIIEISGETFNDLINSHMPTTQIDNINLFISVLDDKVGDDIFMIAQKIVDYESHNEWLNSIPTTISADAIDNLFSDSVIPMEYSQNVEGTDETTSVTVYTNNMDNNPLLNDILETLANSSGGISPNTTIVTSSSGADFDAILGGSTENTQTPEIDIPDYDNNSEIISMILYIISLW